MKKHIFAQHWSKSISGLAWFSSNLFPFRTCTATASCTLSRIGKHGENVPVERRQGLFMHWVHTVCTITYITSDSRSCRKNKSPLVLSNTVVQKKNPKFLFALLFLPFHWLKELRNILSNGQYLNIFYLVKLQFFVIHSVSPKLSEISLTEASLFVYPCSQLARYKSFQNSNSLHLHSPQNLFL